MSLAIGSPEFIAPWKSNPGSFGCWFGWQRNWSCFCSSLWISNSLFTGRPAKIHTQWPSVLVLQIPFSQMDFWREATTADSFRATLLHAPATFHTCFFQESLRKRMNQRRLQIKKNSWMFKTWHGLNLEVRNDQVDPPFVKHVTRLFAVASWVLKKHVKISGLQRITSDLQQEVFYKKWTCHQDLFTRNTERY